MITRNYSQPNFADGLEIGTRDATRASQLAEHDMLSS